MEKTERTYKYDNLRFVLIFLVIFAHFMELFFTDRTSGIYRIIYSFHMPLFIFLTGIFARFKPMKIVFNFFIPYIVFQTMYLIFDALVLRKASFADIVWQYTTPYWLLWYLFVIIGYYLLIPLLDNHSHSTKICILVAAVILSLIAPYDTSIGYYLSLSRFFSFLPYFIAGYYFGKADSSRTAPVLHKKAIIIPCTLVCIVAAVVLYQSGIFSPQMLYGSYSYQATSGNALLKLILVIIAGCFILCLLSFTPDKRIPVISKLGENTFAIFLCHGFIVKLIAGYSIFHFRSLINGLIDLGLTLIIIVLFGNPIISNGFKWIFSEKWFLQIKALIGRKKQSNTTQSYHD